PLQPFPDRLQRHVDPGSVIGPPAGCREVRPEIRRTQVEEARDVVRAGRSGVAVERIREVRGEPRIRKDDVAALGPEVQLVADRLTYYGHIAGGPPRRDRRDPRRERR